MKLLRILIALVMVAAITTAVTSDQARHPKPEGATVIAATPRAPAAPEPEVPAPPPPPVETLPGAEPPPPSPTLEGSAPPPTGTGINQCIEVTSANLGLVTAQDRDTARAAADALEKYDPPANVRNAIEYFVGAPGAMFNDPDFAARNEAISEWVKQLCPSF